MDQSNPPETTTICISLATEWSTIRWKLLEFAITPEVANWFCHWNRFNHPLSPYLLTRGKPWSHPTRLNYDGHLQNFSLRYHTAWTDLKSMQHNNIVLFLQFNGEDLANILGGLHFNSEHTVFDVCGFRYHLYSKSSDYHNKSLLARLACIR